MEAFLFIFISVMEYFGFMVAMLALFRYPVNYYWPQIIFSSLICSMISYVLSVENNLEAAPLIQLVALALCIWLMYNTPLLWSMIMCFSTVTVYAIFQGGFLYLLASFHVVPLGLPKTSIEMYLIQIFSSTICLTLGWYWLRNRIGFLFVPTSRDTPYVWSKTGKWLFIISVIEFFIVGTIVIFYSNGQFSGFSIILAALIIIFCLLLYFMKRKNEEYVQKKWTR